MNTRSPVLVVRAFVKDRQGRILLLRRTNTRYACGEWVFPGGKMDYLDSPESSIVREVLEETGLHCVVFHFEARANGTVLLNEESDEYAWVFPADAIRYQPAFHGREALTMYINITKSGK